MASSSGAEKAQGSESGLPQIFDKEPFALLMGKIPERSSSLLSTKAKPFLQRARQVFGTLVKLEGTLKRKASDLSLANSKPLPERRAAELEYLEAVIEQRKLIDNMSRASMSVLVEDYKANKIDEADFTIQMRDITRKQNKLFNGDVTISRQRDYVLKAIDKIVVEEGKDESEMTESLTLQMYNILRGKPPGRDGEQVQWRMDLYNHYGSQPQPHGPVWCPISKSSAPYKEIKAAHLVPYKIGYETMGHLFDGDGYSLMWSMGNGLPMRKQFERHFDNYDFCILPRESPGKPDEFQLVLMNEEIRYEESLFGKTWDDFDEQMLGFVDGNDARPSKRFLYFHYWMCIIKTKRELTKGWKDVREKTRMGRLWTTPGPYLRKAMVKKLGESIGDFLLPEQEEIVNNTFPGTHIQAEHEDMSVKDILSVMLPREEDEDKEDD